jgi:hypothetical protein
MGADFREETKTVNQDKENVRSRDRAILSLEMRTSSDRRETISHLIDPNRGTHRLVEMFCRDVGPS